MAALSGNTSLYKRIVHFDSHMPKVLAREMQQPSKNPTRYRVNPQLDIEQALSCQNAQFFLIAGCVRRELVEMAAVSGSSLL